LLRNALCIGVPGLLGRGGQKDVVNRSCCNLVSRWSSAAVVQVKLFSDMSVRIIKVHLNYLSKHK